MRRRLPTFGLSWRILGLVVVAVMTAEILLFLPSIARFRLVYLEQLIESGTLAALALDPPDNMVTEEVKRAAEPRPRRRRGAGRAAQAAPGAAQHRRGRHADLQPQERAGSA